MSVVNFVKNQ
jgi:hypothetical protein